MIEKGNKKIIRGWVMYDWANSVYNLVISSAIFPIFYTNITRKLYVQSLESAGKVYEEGMPVLVDFFGFQLESQVLISYILSASFLVVSFLSPLLSGIADFIGNKKRFMQFFCYLGAFSTMALSYFENNIELGLIAVFLASIGFWNSLVFYNAYLPEIAEPEDHDKISARGFTMGYFGSMLLLIISLGIIMGFGPEYTKYCFILVGLWWIGFSQITYKVLPNNVYGKKREKGFIWKGFRS